MTAMTVALRPGGGSLRLSQRGFGPGSIINSVTMNEFVFDNDEDPLRGQTLRDRYLLELKVKSVDSTVSGNSAWGRDSGAEG